MTEYFIKTIGCMGISVFLYYILLKPGRNFLFNRFYLLTSLLLSISVPSLKISSPHITPVIKEIGFNNIIANDFQMNEILDGVIIENAENYSIPIQQILLFIYSIVTLILLLRFIINLIRIIRYINIKRHSISGMRIVTTTIDTNPYSFFNVIIMNQNEWDRYGISDAVIEHEKIHSRQYHSIDIIIIELIKCFLWFNPFVWFYKKTISENHEYLADFSVINKGYNIETYSNKLILNASRQKSNMLVSGFSYIQTKNRLIMLNKKRSSLSKRVVRFFLVLSISVTTLALNSFEYISKAKPLLVVVDAGHGGKDNGASCDTYYEKDINLSISNKLASISGNSNIKIILTQEDDTFLTLKDRADFVNDIKPDLLLSIHCNYAKNSQVHGSEGYYFKEGQYETQSYLYCKTLLSEHSKPFTDVGAIKTANFYVLKNVDCPGVILQLGFLSNENELKKLADENNQAQIANSIYEGLLKILKRDL
ncbi:N-acetylmuramoyl-L-alanine amidase [Bacteroidota bacterium]